MSKISARHPDSGVPADSLLYRCGMQSHRLEHAEGFSLIEALVAIGVIVVVVTSLSQLFVMATMSNAGARARTAASLLAAEKVEELRGGTALISGGSLDQDLAGYSDYLDLFGRTTDLARAAFIRRWSVQPLRTDAANGLAISVVVLPRSATGQRTTGPDVIRLVTARTRKAR